MYGVADSLCVVVQSNTLSRLFKLEMPERNIYIILNELKISMDLQLFVILISISYKQSESLILLSIWLY